MYEYLVSIYDEEKFQILEYLYAELIATDKTLRGYQNRMVDESTQEFYHALLEQKKLQKDMYQKYLSDVLNIEVTQEMIITYPTDCFQQKKVYIVSPFEIPELKN